MIPGVVLEDAYHNIFTVDVSMGVVDDMPQVGFSATDATIGSGADHSGTVTVDYGADLAAAGEALHVTVRHPGAPDGSEVTVAVTAGQAIPVVIDGVNYGTLTFAPDVNGASSYTFAAEPNVNGSLVISLAATDADGDVVSNDFTLNIVNPDGPGIPFIGYGDANATFDEANFDNGTSPNIGALSKSLSIPAGYTVDVKGADSPWAAEADTPDNVIWRLTGDYGQLTYNSADNTLTYTLTGRVGNAPDSDVGQDVIPGVVLKDADGNTY